MPTGGEYERAQGGGSQLRWARLQGRKPPPLHSGGAAIEELVAVGHADQHLNALLAREREQRLRLQQAAVLPFSPSPSASNTAAAPPNLARHRQHHHHLPKGRGNPVRSLASDDSKHGRAGQLAQSLHHASGAELPRLSQQPPQQQQQQPPQQQGAGAERAVFTSTRPVSGFGAVRHRADAARPAPRPRLPSPAASGPAKGQRRGGDEAADDPSPLRQGWGVDCGAGPPVQDPAGAARPDGNVAVASAAHPSDPLDAAPPSAHPEAVVGDVGRPGRGERPRARRGQRGGADGDRTPEAGGGLFTLDQGLNEDVLDAMIRDGLEPDTPELANPGAGSGGLGPAHLALQSHMTRFRDFARRRSQYGSPDILLKYLATQEFTTELELVLFVKALKLHIREVRPTRFSQRFPLRDASQTKGPRQGHQCRYCVQVRVGGGYIFFGNADEFGNCIECGRVLDYDVSGRDKGVARSDRPQPGGKKSKKARKQTKRSKPRQEDDDGAGHDDASDQAVASGAGAPIPKAARTHPVALATQGSSSEQEGRIDSPSDSDDGNTCPGPDLSDPVDEAERAVEDSPAPHADVTPEKKDATGARPSTEKHGSPVRLDASPPTPEAERFRPREQPGDNGSCSVADRPDSPDSLGWGAQEEEEQIVTAPATAAGTRPSSTTPATTKPTAPSNKKDSGRLSMRDRLKRMPAAKQEREAKSRFDSVRVRRGLDEGDVLGSGTDPLDLLSKYYILPPNKEKYYKRVFEAFDLEGGGSLGHEAVSAALQHVNDDLLSIHERRYIFTVLGLVKEHEDYMKSTSKRPGSHKFRNISFQQFAVVAALSERVVGLDPWVRDCICKMDDQALYKKLSRGREIFYCNDPDKTGRISLEAVGLEMKAGGFSAEHEATIVEHFEFKGITSFTFLDFLAYLPLFVEVHENIIGNPLQTRQQQDGTGTGTPSTGDEA